MQGEFPVKTTHGMRATPRGHHCSSDQTSPIHSQPQNPYSTPVTAQIQPPLRRCEGKTDKYRNVHAVWERRSGMATKARFLTVDESGDLGLFRGMPYFPGSPSTASPLCSTPCGRKHQCTACGRHWREQEREEKETSGAGRYHVLSPPMAPTTRSWTVPEQGNCKRHTADGTLARRFAGPTGTRVHINRANSRTKRP